MRVFSGVLLYPTTSDHGRGLISVVLGAGSADPRRSRVWVSGVRVPGHKMQTVQPALSWSLEGMSWRWLKSYHTPMVLGAFDSNTKCEYMSMILALKRPKDTHHGSRSSVASLGANKRPRARLMLEAFLPTTNLHRGDIKCLV